MSWRAGKEGIMTEKIPKAFKPMVTPASLTSVPICSVLSKAV